MSVCVSVFVIVFQDDWSSSELSRNNAHNSDDKSNNQETLPPGETHHLPIMQQNHGVLLFFLSPWAKCKTAVIRMKKEPSSFV